MRTVHGDLLVAQQSGAANPYIYLNINSTDYSSRLLQLEHIEEPYRDRATIVLANSDHHFDSNSLLGKSFSIGYGYYTDSGNRYCGDGSTDGTPTLWVKSQSQVSLEGKLVCILYCEGGWMKLREHSYIATAEGKDAPYFSVEFTATEPLFDLIEKVLVEAGFTLNGIGDQSDGIIDVFQPIFTANPLTYDNGASIIYRLIQMSKCFLREVESLAFEVVYPQSLDAVKETYSSYAAPYFREYVEKSNLLIPNSIAVFCNRDPDGSWNTAGYPLIIGEAIDQPSIDAYEAVWEYHIAPYITSQEDADNRAEAILERYRSEILSGRVVLPFHDCRVELYDRVKIWDVRGY